MEIGKLPRLTASPLPIESPYPSAIFSIPPFLRIFGKFNPPFKKRAEFELCYIIATLKRDVSSAKSPDKSFM